MKLLTHDELVAKLDTELFRTLGRTADALGYECYVIGGYVRDLFLERSSNDIDVVVVGSGVEMGRRFAEAIGHKHLAVYANFGTAQVKWHGMEIEFVGARRESYQRDSRKPIVEGGTR